MGWLIFSAVILSALAICCLLESGKEYGGKNGGGKGLLILGIALLAISGSVTILVSREMGLGKIADNGKL